nr:penicillin acylase family protein [Propionibacteriales bacterium]
GLGTASTGSDLDSGIGTGNGFGSNAWAVSGEHTASGAPILANDPHLGATIPGVWYQMGLHCNQVSRECPFDVSGFTFAGLPGIVIGHNADVAWGFTNLAADVEDLYLERVVGDDEYLYDGGLRKLLLRREAFTVEGEDDPVVITVRESRHGPLISDVSDDLSAVGAAAPVPKGSPARGAGYAVALRWTGLQPGRTAEALFGFDTARNWNDFREAGRDFAAPGQNLVYADDAGHIGYQATGQIPIRRTGHGDWPVPGWDSAYEWDRNAVSFDALPSVLDPVGGYVIAANQAVTRPRYPYYLGDSFDYGYRSQRIRGLLADHDDLTVDDMAAVQLDDHNLLGERLAPLLRSIRLPSHYYRQGQRILAEWDFRQAADSAGAAYFAVVWSRILDLTFDDQLPDDARPDGGARWWQVVMGLVKDPDNAFWDNVDTVDTRETRDDILAQALTEARDELTSIRSRDPHDWAWGDLHTLTLRNQTVASAGSPVGFLFNRGGYQLSGGPRWSMRPAGTRATGMSSRRSRRCVWSSRWTTSTRQGGSA